MRIAPISGPIANPLQSNGTQPRIVVGISGATGIIYGVRLLEVLRNLNIETHLVVTKPGDQTRALETDISASDLRALATVSYNINDIAAPIASGSFRTHGMMVVPCSMRSLAEIASGVSSTLLTRAADVTLKERRPLVLAVRESPLSRIHLRNMLEVTEAGAIIFPPMVAFYNKPKTLAEIVDQQVARMLDQFGLCMPGAVRWGEEALAIAPC